MKIYKENENNDDNNEDKINEFSPQGENKSNNFLAETLDFTEEELPLYILKDKRKNYIIPENYYHAREIKEKLLLYNKPNSKEFDAKLKILEIIYKNLRQVTVV